MKLQQKSTFCGARAIFEQGYECCDFLYRFNFTCFIAAGFNVFASQRESTQKLILQCQLKVLRLFCILLSLYSDKPYQFRDIQFAWINKIQERNFQMNHESKSEYESGLLRCRECSEKKHYLMLMIIRCILSSSLLQSRSQHFAVSVL